MDAAPLEEEDYFDLDALPDDVCVTILSHCTHWAVAGLACTSRRWKGLVASSASDDMWGFVQRRNYRHPQHAINGSWRSTFDRSLEIDRSWRTRRFAKKEFRHHVSFVFKVHMFGDRVVTASADESLRIFGLPPKTGAAAHIRGATFPAFETCIGQLTGLTAPVTSCRFLNDQRVLSSTAAHDLCMWDISDVPVSPLDTLDLPASTQPAQGKRLVTKRLTSPSRHGEFFEVAPRGERIATAACELGSGVRIYDLATFECMAALETIEDEVFSLAWADGNSCYIACGDGKVRLWDTRCARTEYPGYDGSPRGPSRCIQLQEDILACGGGRGELRLFDVRKMDRSSPMTARRLHNDYVSAVRFSPRHGWAVSGGDDCGVALLRFPSLTEVGRLPTPMGVLSLDFDHSRIVAGCEDSVLRVWDADVPEDFVDFDAVANALRAAAARGRRNVAIAGATDGNGAGVDPFLRPAPFGGAAVPPVGGVGEGTTLAGGYVEPPAGTAPLGRTTVYV